MENAFRQECQITGSKEDLGQEVMGPFKTVLTSTENMDNGCAKESVTAEMSQEETAA